MRVTVCELPHETTALAAAWAALCDHTRANGSELVLLPEFAMLEPIWELEQFDLVRWRAIEALTEIQLRRLPELGTGHVVGTRPISEDGRRLNQGYLWSARDGMRPLRSKYFMPDEPGNWEATWFHPGSREFPLYQAGPVSFGLNICSEMWALETYGDYAALDKPTVQRQRAVGDGLRMDVDSEDLLDIPAFLRRQAD